MRRFLTTARTVTVGTTFKRFVVDIIRLLRLLYVLFNALLSSLKMAIFASNFTTEKEPLKRERERGSIIKQNGEEEHDDDEEWWCY